MVAFLLMLGRAAVERARRPQEMSSPDDIRELQEALGRLTAEVGELHERLDFAERVLAAQRGPERLEGGP